MSIGSRAFFCHNGHLTYIFEEYAIGMEIDGKYIETAINLPCPICGSTQIKCCYEWGNPDYPSGMAVATKPIAVRGTGRFVEIMEETYDVSKLFKKKEVKCLH